MTSNPPQTWQRTLLPFFITDDNSPLDNYSSTNNHPHALSYEACETLCDSDSISWSGAARNIFKRLTMLYLRQPLVLALLPLVIGIVIGYLISHRKLPTKILHKFTPLLLAPMNYFLFLPSITETETRRDGRARQSVKKIPLIKKSGVPPSLTPRHIAVIMDGNRRYGKSTYGSATRGHHDGSRKLVEFSKWCLAEGIAIVTVYAFSTENWLRAPDEVSTLMGIFVTYCDEMRREAMENGIRIKVLTTDDSRLPEDVKVRYRKLVDDTAHCGKMIVNICLSYGSRGEIVGACREIAEDVRQGNLMKEDITEKIFEEKLLLPESPDVVIRTSGEKRLSNFLLWQVAYAEMFFWDKRWPEVTRDDLVGMIQSYAGGRQRRFGK